MSTRGAATTLKRRLLGVAFIGLVAGLIALSIALFNHAFANNTVVQLKTDEVGNQMSLKADVKARGVIIGKVSEITPTQEGATLELALDPEKAKLIPQTASARLLPKTLFGERFVSLQFEHTGAGEPLSSGDVIPQDRSQAAMELGEAFEKLLPVLRAVEPQKLNSTLTVMSRALQGRGEELGQTLAELGAYFGDLNPHLPELEHQFEALAEFSHNFADAVPDLAQTLDNFKTPSRLVVEKQQNLESVYATVTTASNDLQAFLAANQQNIISLGEASRPTLELLAMYSDEFPCVLGQMADTVDRVDKALGKGTEHPGLRAEVVITPNRGEFIPGRDEPEFNFFDDDLGYRGPYCVRSDKLPEPLPYPYPPFAIDDGSEHPPPARSELDGEPFPCDAIDTFGRPVPAGIRGNCAPGTAERSGGGSAVASLANSPAEHSVLTELIGLQTGMDAQQMPGWTGLLVGPLYRGAEVTIQ
ncbi:MAG: MCE family protein [Pseudonocardiaceae bacterium]